MRARLRRPSLLVKFSLLSLLVIVALGVAIGSALHERIERRGLAQAMHLADVMTRVGVQADAAALRPARPAAAGAPGRAGRRAAPRRLPRPADQPGQALQPPRRDRLLGRPLGRSARSTPPPTSSRARSAAEIAGEVEEGTGRGPVAAHARSRSTCRCACAPRRPARPPCSRSTSPTSRSRPPIAEDSKRAVPAARRRPRAALRGAVPDRRRRLAPPAPPGAARRAHRPAQPHAALRAHRGRDRRAAPQRRAWPRCC